MKDNGWSGKSCYSYYFLFLTFPFFEYKQFNKIIFIFIFAIADVYTYLLGQNKANRKKFISTESKHLTNGECVIIVEPFDEKFQLIPNLPAFNDHLKKHRETLSPNTASRNLKASLEEEMKALGFYLDYESYYYVPSLIPEYKEKYYEYMVATSKIIGCKQNVINDIKTWYQVSDAFAQIGMFMNCYTKLISEKNKC